MKAKFTESQIVDAVCTALNVDEFAVAMPISESGCVEVKIPGHEGSRRCEWSVYLPNDELARMICGDRWDGDASDGAFRFGGGGYDPVWFECGVEG